MSSEVVMARSLTKKYGTFTAVDSIDFTIHGQECFAFLGPNGAGKSSSLRMIACLSPVSGGTLEVLGMPAAPNNKAIKSRLGIVSQDDNLDVDLTVMQNLLIHGLYFSMKRETIMARGEQLLSFFGLDGKSRAQVKELSGGMRRRLAIARALLQQPDILMLDEPTTGLDPQARILVWERLLSLKSQGVTLILTTHFMDEAERLADRILVIDHGTIIAQGTPAELVHKIGRVTVEMEAPGDASERLRQELSGLVRHTDVQGERLLVYTDEEEAILDRLRSADLLPPSFSVRPSNLEDVFLTLTGRELRD